jgi:hypothetical protein
MPEASWLWRAFTLLSVQRSFSHHGPLPIAIRDVHAYAQMEELDGADSRWLMDVVVSLDQIFLEESYDRVKKEHAQQAKKARSRGHR